MAGQWAVPSSASGSSDPTVARWGWSGCCCAISRICSREIARTGLNEREAADAGLDVLATTVETDTRAGYFPGSAPMWVKLVAARDDHRLLGAQIVGAPTAGKRIDTFATAIWTGLTVDELQWVDLSYAPPMSGVLDPVLVAARASASALARAA